MEECLQRRLITSEDGLEDLDELSKETPLFTQATTGESEAARLLCQDPDFRLEQDASKTALYRCVEMGFFEVVGVLLDQKADPNIQEAERGTGPLHIAALNGQQEVAQRLLTGGANPNLQDKSGSGPLHWAAENGQQEVVQRLLAGGANRNLQNENGDTPLHCAGYAGHLEAARVLLVAHAAVDVRNTHGWTLLKWAQECNKPQLVELLRQHGATD